MSYKYLRQRRSYSDNQRPQSDHLPLRKLHRKCPESQRDEHFPRLSKAQNSTEFLKADSDDDSDSFQKEVTEKTKMYLVGKQEAEMEVTLERYIKRTGSVDRALLYIVSELSPENKVQRLMNGLLHRGANPSASNKDLWTPLHYAVKKNYKGVCSKLLEHKAWPDARDKKGVMPYTIAFETGNDDIAAMLITQMSNKFVRKLYTSEGNESAEFSFHTLLNKNMENTVMAILDCMIDPVSPSGDVCVHYNVLEADENGRVPKDSNFNPRSKSGLQIIAKSGNKTIVYHVVVRLLIRRKWKEYARLRFLINSIFYIFSLITITFSAIVASSASDPSVYDNSLQIARAVCEVWSLGMAILTLFSELNQLRKHRLEYWQDAFNWIDLSSSILIILILPLRFTHKSEQWFVFSAAYLLWTVRIFKYAAVFRQTGAYAQILWRILIHDIFQFTTFFLFILLAFSGCLLLSLRGEGSLEQFHESSSFWDILFLGGRILIESERIVEYTELQTTSLIIMAVFLFTICVLLLNILIAQLSDTYQNVQQDAQRGLRSENRAWIVAKSRLNSLLFGKGHRISHYKESENIDDIKDVLEKWESPPLNEINKCIQHISDDLDSHKINLLTIKKTVARQEVTLSTIQISLDKLLELEKRRQRQTLRRSITV
ncbi:transient receptor potential cation channel subfamily V member 5-like [Saccostrea cucullata]|uniref:transient receptor potential cation channel subfamily V member 5-like n=1 Tax=Saccostrea cuccullata TaxID=36930 RepID=UPI002ED24E37